MTNDLVARLITAWRDLRLTRAEMRYRKALKAVLIARAAMREQVGHD